MPVNSSKFTVNVTTSLAALPIGNTPSSAYTYFLGNDSGVTISFDNPTGSGGTFNALAIKKVDPNGNVKQWFASTPSNDFATAVSVMPDISGGNSGTPPNNIPAGSSAYVVVIPNGASGIQIFGQGSAAITGLVITIEEFSTAAI